MTAPLSDEQIADMRASLEAADDEVSALCDGTRRWTMSVPAREDHDSDLILTAALSDMDDLLTEVKRLKAQWAEFEWAEMLTHQSCAAGKHADWWVDSEHNHLCPWCEIDRLKAAAAQGEASQ